ncbi:MAG: hypothetical protein GDA49_01635 [Rhodospirillales bacterium]|nr:hypothetical protein [Rhodospirillales bacterium]
MDRPVLIRDVDVPWDRYSAFSGDFAIKCTISRSEHGSDLALGIWELEPGQSTIWWLSIKGNEDPDVSMRFGRAYEAWSCAWGVLGGGFTFHWVDRHGRAESGEDGSGDSFYFALNWRYRVENRGCTKARFLWCMAPAA